MQALLRSPMIICLILIGVLAAVAFSGDSGDGLLAAERPSLWISLLPMLLCLGIHLFMCRGHGHGKAGAACHKEADEAGPAAALAAAEVTPNEAVPQPNEAEPARRASST